MPAIAHRNCRLPGKTRAAMQLRKLRDIKWRDQPTTKPGTLDAHQGRNRKETKKEAIPHVQTEPYLF